MSGERILVVEDSDDMRDFLVNAVLKSEGYAVSEAKDGAEGLALALTIEPDLIVTDYSMPDLTGLQMLKKIEDAGRYFPAILVTGEGSESIAVQAMRLGVIDYFIKPYDAEVLLAAIERGLERTRIFAPTISRFRPDLLASLVEVGQHVISSRDLDSVLSVVVAESVRLTEAEEGMLMLRDMAKDELYVVAAKSANEDIVHNLRLPVNDSLAGQVVSERKPLFIGEGEHKIKTQYLVKSLAYVPMFIRGQVIGVLGLTNRTEEKTLDTADLEVLNVLASYAAISIDNARAFAERETEMTRLRTIFSQSSEAAILIDDEGYITYITSGACDAFGLDPLDASGRTIPEVITNLDLNGLLERHMPDRVSRGEVALPDGRILNARITSMKDKSVMLTMHDVTHLKQVDRARTHYVTTVSHDLRSPLTVILSYVELLERAGEINAQQREFVERIRSNVQTMSELIGALLELGQIESGVEQVREPVRLSDLLSNVIKEQEGQYATKNQKIDVTLSDGLPPVLGNPIRLRQALSNLVDNAIKYTPEQGSIYITTDTTDEHVLVMVRDTGIGIPLDDQPYIFDEFYRARGVSGSYVGSGLGLSIVKSIVDSHAGRIWVESKSGDGSTFIVMLPAYVSDGGK